MEIYRSKKKKESQPIIWADEFEKWKYFHLYFRCDLRWHSFFLLKIRNSTKTNKAEQRRKKILIFRIYSRKWQSNGYIWKPIIDFAIKYVRHFEFVIFPRMTKVTNLEKREKMFFFCLRGHKWNRINYYCYHSPSKQQPFSEISFYESILQEKWNAHYNDSTNKYKQKKPIIKHNQYYCSLFSYSGDFPQLNRESYAFSFFSPVTIQINILNVTIKYTSTMFSDTFDNKLSYLNAKIKKKNWKTRNLQCEDRKREKKNQIKIYVFLAHKEERKQWHRGKFTQQYR